MPLNLLGSTRYDLAGFGGAMLAAWRDDFEKVRPFFRRDPRQAADWTALLAELSAHRYPRQELSRMLVRSAEELHAPEQALAGAQALEQPHTLAVLTGQQPGLFGGPLYSLFKALTAVKWARELTRRHGPKFQFVPVFWVASDDHDLAEIDHAFFLDEGVSLERLRVELDSESRGVAAGEVSIRTQVEALREPLVALLPGAAETLLAPYRARSMGGAFAHLLAQWLGPLGLVVVESTSVRPFGAELFARELDEFPASCRALRTPAAGLEAAGYKPEFVEAKEAPHLFFMTEHKVRARLEPVEGAHGVRFAERSSAFAARGLTPAVHAKDELKLLLRSRPSVFSGSAALRPVLQELVFPVAAAVLGPGEFAYWAQLGPLHDRYGAVWPMLVPRLSATLLDAAASKSVRKLEAQAADLFLPREELKRKLLSGGQADAVLEEGTQKILAELEALAGRIRELDRGLDPLFEKARERIGHELGRIVEKTKASLAQKDGAGLARLEHVIALVRPRGKPQERVLCAAQFLARHPELPKELLEALDPMDFRHQVWAVE